MFNETDKRSKYAITIGEAKTNLAKKKIFFTHIAQKLLIVREC